MQSVEKRRRGERGGDEGPASPPGVGPRPPAPSSSSSSSSSQDLPSKRLPASSQLPSPLAAQAVVTRQPRGGVALLCVDKKQDCVCDGALGLFLKKYVLINGFYFNALSCSFVFSSKKLTVFECLLFYYIIINIIIIIIIFVRLASLVPPPHPLQKLGRPSDEVLSVKENLI